MQDSSKKGKGKTTTQLMLLISILKYLTTTIKINVFVLAIILCSCHGLNAIQKTKGIQTITSNNLRVFDGDYNITSIDSSYRSLDEALLNTSLFDYKHPAINCDRLHLKVIDDHRVEVSVYKNDKMVKRKIIKGHIVHNYFEFKLRKFSVKYVVLNLFTFVNTRFALLENGDLSVDCSGGGFLTLVVIPTLGNGAQLYGLVYKRRDDCH